MPDHRELAHDHARAVKEIEMLRVRSQDACAVAPSGRAAGLRPGRHRGIRFAGLKRAGLLALLVTILAACAFDDNRPSAEVAVPAMYRQAAKPAGRASTPLPVRWSDLFGSPELDRLDALALSGNLDIASALAQIRQADAQVRVASAPLYPNLNGSADASRVQTPGTLRSKNGPYRASDSNLLFAGLTASYTLDLWDKNKATAQAAEDQAIASRFNADVVALATSATLANAYLQVLAAQDRLKIGQNNLQLAEKVLNAIRGRLSVGTASALDVAQQESLVATQRAALPLFEQEVQQNKIAIGVLLGRPPESVAIRGGSLARLHVPSIKPGLPSQLLLRRPDIAEAETNLAAQNANVAAARAAFFPTIQLTSRAFVESLVLKTLLRPDALLASAAADVMQPIFDGYQLQGQLDLQNAKYDELVQAYRRSIVAALGDVETALVAVAQTARHEWLQTQAVVASRRAYQITDSRLREGIIDIVTLLNTQQTLFQNEDVLVQVRLSRFQAIVSLIQALGGGWVKPPDGASVEPQLPARIAKAGGIPAGQNKPTGERL
jgi:multidrug efflux system outer membrane protein